MATASAILDLYVAKFDDTRPHGLVYLNERYRTMVVDAQWFVRTADIATTVADQAEYDIPDSIEDLEAVYVDGERYYPVSMDDIRLLDADDANVTSSFPVFAQDYDETGALRVRLWPVPDTTGDSITATSSGNPVALTDTDDAAGTPSIPADLHRYLRDGLWSDGYNEVDERPDMAAVHERRFVDEGIVKLRKRKLSRFGSGPSTLNVSSGGW